MKLNHVKVLILTITCLCIVIVHSPVKSMANGLDQTISDCIGENKNCDEMEPAKEQNQGQTEANTSTPGVTFIDGLRMIAALAFVVFLLYVLLKFVNKKNLANQSNSLVKNLGGVSVGGKNSVQIVKIGNEIYILGVGEEVRLIKEITDEKVIKQYIEQYEEQLGSMSQPIDVFKKWLHTRSEGKEEKQPKINFQSHLKKQLTEIKESRKDAMEKLNHKENQQDE